MSGAPKRSHEEGSHLTTSKRPIEGTSMFSGKCVQSFANDFHPPDELSHDGRFAKFQRIESRDGDKRQSLISSYRMSSSANDSCSDQPISSENKLESRDSKENRDSKIENREAKAEIRDLYSETRLDPQATKGEKEMRSENKGEVKELKSDRESHSDFKGEMKIEKDIYSVGISHSNRNELKEYKGKRNCESLNDGDPGRLGRKNLQNMDESGKEASVTEEREHSETCEAFGESKPDLKGEDKLKEKEKKQKEEKYKEWIERDKDRNDRRSNLQLGSTSTERMESTREERERWERERKDVLKDKERPKDRDKGHIKREVLNANEEALHNVKELVDGSARMVEQESSTLELKRQKELDIRKAVDRDVKDRKREKDMDVEGSRNEKRGRYHDKETNDGCVVADGVLERDRESFSYGVQQRRGMLRPRGAPQSENREPHFSSHARDNDRSQAKADVSTVVYKAGECMQELIKLWKEFEASEDYRNNTCNGPTLEIRIPAEHVMATNRQVRGGQLWGTDIYTDDSDLVAVLMHTGYCRPTASAPPPSIQELRATIRVLPPLD